MPLSDYEPTEIVGVTRQHIQETMSALSWAYNYFAALDHTERARKGGADITPSAITRNIERAYNHLEGYITEPEVMPNE